MVGCVADKIVGGGEYSWFQHLRISHVDEVGTLIVNQTIWIRLEACKPPPFVQADTLPTSSIRDGIGFSGLPFRTQQTVQ